MNILHVVQSLDPSWGGIARVLPELAGRLAATGDKCRIATLVGGRFGEAQYDAAWQVAAGRGGQVSATHPLSPSGASRSQSTPSRRSSKYQRPFSRTKRSW